MLIIVSFDGQLLKRLIKETGLSQKEFAKKIGISYSMLLKIENGHKNPSLALAHVIARYFGLTIDDFIKEV